MGPRQSRALLAQIGRDDVGVAQNFRRRAVGDAFAEIEHRDVIGDLLHHRHVVIDDKDRQPVSFEAREQTNEFVFLNVIETGSWFIEEQQLRAAGESAGDFHAALMSIAEAADPCSGMSRNTDEIERG
jgi:hypothetical protein